jgi:hypothetical protein
MRNEYLERFLEIKKTDDKWNESKDYSNPEFFRWMIGRHSLRDRFVKQYAWAIPDPQALATISKYGPLLEVAAGSGYWASLLRGNVGADVLATDLDPWDHPYTEVLAMEAAKAVQTFGEGRSLLFVWPGMGDRDLESLHQYMKQKRPGHVIYVGEGRGGCTGSTGFHRRLAKNWTLVEKVGIPQWFGKHDYLAVYAPNF